MNQFICNTRIVTGPDALQALQQEKHRRVMVVTDPFFAKNGMAQTVAQAAGAQCHEIYDGVQPDPTVEQVAAGTAAVKAFCPDCIVALGGGSAMDCAKAMAYFSSSDAALIAIPTTSGSGSEVTDFAVLTHEKVKYPLVDPRLQPSMAILDPRFVEQLPPSLVADGGFDVLAHAAESFVARDATPVTRALAEDAFRTAFALLPASFAGRKEARLPIHIASTMAGMAFSSAGLGVCHAISHALGGMFHVPHGRLNAILLPAVIGCNSHAAQAQYARLARLAGIGGSADTVAVRNLKNSLIRLRSELKLPATLAQGGIPAHLLWSNMNTIVSAALADPCCKTNPVGVEDYTIRRILEEVAGGD